MSSVTPYLREDAIEDLMFRVHRKECVCEKLRCVYDLVHTLPDTPEKAMMVENILDAFMMAKKMATRLAYYRDTYSDDTGNEGVNLIEVQDLEARRKLRDDRRNAFHSHSDL